MQTEVTRLLGAVPALRTETSGRAPLWLRLIATPAELAMLPFEAARAPAGMSGAGGELLASGDRPVVLTREVRTGGPTSYPWPRELRVLFLVASPQQEVPFKAHLKALANALKSWTGPRKPRPGTPTRLETVLLDHAGEPLLDVLQDASLEAIKWAMFEGQYSHVHLLASRQSDRRRRPLRGRPARRQRRHGHPSTESASLPCSMPARAPRPRAP